MDLQASGKGVELRIKKSRVQSHMLLIAAIQKALYNDHNYKEDRTLFGNSD